MRFLLGPNTFVESENNTGGSPLESRQPEALLDRYVTFTYSKDATIVFAYDAQKEKAKRIFGELNVKNR